MAEWVAAGLAAIGQPEVADAVRQYSDVLERSVELAIDSAACYGTAAAGGAAGAAIGCAFPIPIVGCAAGWLVGTVAGALLNPACKEALDGVGAAVQEAVKAGEAIAAAAEAVATAGEPDSQLAPAGPSQSSRSCSGKAFSAADALECVDACESKVPETSW